MHLLTSTSTSHPPHLSPPLQLAYNLPSQVHLTWGVEDIRGVLYVNDTQTAAQAQLKVIRHSCAGFRSCSALFGRSCSSLLLSAATCCSPRALNSHFSQGNISAEEAAELRAEAISAAAQAYRAAHQASIIIQRLQFAAWLPRLQARTQRSSRVQHQARIERAAARMQPYVPVVQYVQGDECFSLGAANRRVQSALRASSAVSAAADSSTTVPVTVPAAGRENKLGLLGAVLFGSQSSHGNFPRHAGTPSQGGSPPNEDAPSNVRDILRSPPPAGSPELQPRNISLRRSQLPCGLPLTCSCRGRVNPVVDSNLCYEDVPLVTGADPLMYIT